MGFGIALMLLVVLFIVRGGNSIFIKLAQNNRVSTLRQTLVFMFFFALFQVIIFLVLPPYHFQAVTFDFIIFPLCFALFFSLAHVFMLLAINIGSASMTNTIFQFGPIVPIMYGLVYWNESLSVSQTAGLILFLLSIFLFNKSDFSIKDIKQKSSAKWLVLSLLSALSAGVSVIFTKQSMLEFPHLYKEYLVLFNLFIVVTAFLFVIFNARPNLKVLSRDKRFLLYIALAALMLNINNYIFVLFIAKMQSAAFLTLISGVSLISIALLGRVVLKERLSRRAVIAILLCIISIVMINLR